jgi:hypothetical protein
MRRRAIALLPALVALAVPASVLAHAGNPNFRSVVDSVSPSVKGLQLQVLNYDDRLEITNRSGQTVTVLGYDDEPYARVLPDGTVEVNQRSPATYLNNDRFAQVTVPRTADSKAPPQWQTLDKTGRFDWHDHRIHWMATTMPPQVKDQSKVTKIFDWKVPLRIANKPATITGTLSWQPRPGGGVPIGAIVAFVVLVVGGGLLVLRVRRRRARESVATEAW